MSYMQGRVAHDADSHVMETRDRAPDGIFAVRAGREHALADRSRDLIQTRIETHADGVAGTAALSVEAFAEREIELLKIL